MEGRISSGGGNSTSVQFELRNLSRDEKRRAALKALGICWGLMVATAPLPPIHWVTVPFFFSFGIYQAMKKMREPTHFVPFSGTCPECGKEIPVAAQAVQNPLSFVCPHCRFQLRLSWD